MKIHKPRLLLGDCIEVLKSLPDESVDLVITDPAYESLEKHRYGGPNSIRKMSTADGWFQTFPNRRYRTLLAQCVRILRPNSHMYLMCDEETMDAVKSFGRRDDKNDLWFHTPFGSLRYWKAVVWDKEIMGMGYHYRARKEFVLFMEKGKRQLHDLGVPDVVSFKALRGKKAHYPTAKPIGLLRLLIKQSSVRGETVLDPFMGGGSTVVAARDLGRRSIGIDLSRKAMKATKRHLRAE